MNQSIIRGTRLIIPFRYGEESRGKRDYWNQISQKEDCYGGRWRETSLKTGEQDVYYHLYDQLDATSLYSDHNIGAVYRYVPPYGDETTLSLLYCTDENTHPFDLLNMQIALFISGVGFLWFDISESDMSVDDYIVFLSRVKELNYRQNLHFFQLPDHRPFSLGSWIAEILDGICGSIRFFNPRRNIIHRDNSPKEVPDKALIFNYVVFPRGCSSPETDAYYMTKGYTKAFSLPLNLSQVQRYMTEETFLYIFTEGVGYYAVNKEENESFYQTTMLRRFRGDYYLLYLLALNQHYSLIDFAFRISTVLPADPIAYLPADYYINSFEGDHTSRFLALEQTVVRLCTEINVFLSRNIRSSVSYISFQNDFYRMLIDTLNIREDIDSLAGGLSSLQRLLTDLKKEISGMDVLQIEKWKKDRQYQKIEEEKEYLRNLAYLDTMTKVYNKNALEVYGREMEEEARKTGKSLFVCMADMNKLKYINDTFGHINGDDAIKQASEILRNSVRKDDKIFRIGGDEFLVVGFCHEKENIVEIFSRKLEEGMRRFNQDSEWPFEVRISYGAVIDNKCYSLEKLREIADERMYGMKGNDARR